MFMMNGLMGWMRVCVCARGGGDHWACLGKTGCVPLCMWQQGRACGGSRMCVSVPVCVCPCVCRGPVSEQK